MSIIEEHGTLAGKFAILGRAVRFTVRSDVKIVLSETGYSTKLESRIRLWRTGE